MLKILPGLGICITVALISLFTAEYFIIGGVTIAILAGIIIGNLIKIPARLTSGIKFSEKKLLPVAIALMGFSLNYTILIELGLPVIIMIICGVAFTISFSMFTGRLLGMDRELNLLVGIGNAVCGSSAIAAAQGVIKTKDEYAGISIGIINLLGTLGIFLLPFLALILPGFSDRESGMLIGNTLQAVGQVTAAGFSIGDEPGKIATIVKMGRVLLISPIVLLLNFRKNGKTKSAGKIPGIPVYILLFILFSIVSSTGIIPARLISILKWISEFSLITAMAATGMNIRFKTLLTSGKKALLTGFITFGGQIVFSTAMIYLLNYLF